MLGFVRRVTVWMMIDMLIASCLHVLVSVCELQTVGVRFSDKDEASVLHVGFSAACMWRDVCLEFEPRTIWFAVA